MVFHKHCEQRNAKAAVQLLQDSLDAKEAFGLTEKELFEGDAKHDL